MADSGYVDWARLESWSSPYEPTGQGQTFVYAFVPADYGATDDAGVSILKTDGAHPDWFVFADGADAVLSGRCPPKISVSNNYRQVLQDNFTSRPLLASVLIGTSGEVYATPDRRTYWSCDRVSDLTRPGRQLIRALSDLYLREPILLTFLDLRPMKMAAPEAV